MHFLLGQFSDPASIVATSENVVVNPKEDATLSCTADGNPLSDDTIHWKKEDFHDFHARTSVMYDKNGTSYLRITQVTRDDLGNFQCIVNNGVGNVTVKDVLLIVKRKLTTRYRNSVRYNFICKYRQARD